jgi:hypothetical protein
MIYLTNFIPLTMLLLIFLSEGISLQEVLVMAVAAVPVLMNVNKAHSK